MADMTATGWEPAGAVVVLDTQRPWGPRGSRRALVQLNFRASWFGTGAVNYPSNGVPCPAPSLVGFRSNISYIIPLGPFVGTNGCGASVAAASSVVQGNLGRKVIPWGQVIPTYGASGASGNGQPFLRFMSGPPLTTAGGGASPSVSRKSFTLEMTTDMAVTTMLVTGAAGQLTAFAIFVEGGR